MRNLSLEAQPVWLSARNYCSQSKLDVLLRKCRLYDAKLAQSHMLFSVGFPLPPIVDFRALPPVSWATRHCRVQSAEIVKALPTPTRHACVHQFGSVTAAGIGQPLTKAVTQKTVRVSSTHYGSKSTSPHWRQYESDPQIASRFHIAQCFACKPR
jgi:hypothetical protein